MHAFKEYLWQNLCWDMNILNVLYFKYFINIFKYAYGNSSGWQQSLHTRHTRYIKAEEDFSCFFNHVYGQTKGDKIIIIFKIITAGAWSSVSIVFLSVRNKSVFQFENQARVTRLKFSFQNLSGFSKHRNVEMWLCDAI